MAERDKAVVISDIHVGTYQSWSWFRREDETRLAEMLNEIAGDSSVKELVLLGDLFDFWLYPVYEVPPKNVQEIIDANPAIKKALQWCVQSIPEVYYMNGNHDMAMVASDLEPFSVGEDKKIRLIGPDEYTAKYDGKRHLEHGHEVDMFNAPVPDEFKAVAIGGYPLGYFITRLTASAPAMLTTRFGRR